MNQRLQIISEKRIPLMVSILQGIGMGIIKIVLAVLSGSWLFLFSAFYNFGIAGAIGAVLKNKREVVGWVVILSSVLFGAYSYWMIRKGQTAQFGMYIAILIAAVTFTDIALAIRGIVRARKNNPNDRIISLISLATALISLTLTQTAILSFALSGQDMSVYNGICGMLFGAVAAVIGVIIVREGRR